MVNRVWSWHFGKGLAGNPNNFNTTGSLPTHPALLDFLAAWFIKNDWSVKRLNQPIVTSKAYRRSSRHHAPVGLRKLDPKQNLYATQLPRRLTAEEMRDAMLVASGELDRQVGSIPRRLDLNLEVAMQPRQIMGALNPFMNLTLCRTNEIDAGCMPRKCEGYVTRLWKRSINPAQTNRVNCEKRPASHHKH